LYRFGMPLRKVDGIEPIDVRNLHNGGLMSRWVCNSYGYDWLSCGWLVG